jgi:hypothetical protein
MIDPPFDPRQRDCLLQLEQRAILRRSRQCNKASKQRNYRLRGRFQSFFIFAPRC